MSNNVLLLYTNSGNENDQTLSLSCLSNGYGKTRTDITDFKISINLVLHPKLRVTTIGPVDFNELYEK